MTPRRIIVFLPCHSLDDFPTWLGDPECDDLLAAWTAAWDPRLVAASGRVPAWASVESPPGNDVEVLGIVTAHCDDRLAGLIDPASTPGSRWVRRAGGREETVRQSLVALGLPDDDVAPPDAVVAGGPDGRRTVAAADFHAFGLAWLLGELLARRMRSNTGLASAPFTGRDGDPPADGLEARLVSAARSWVAGDRDDAAAGLAECFGHLEAARARYYPVDLWLVDVVLLAETTLGRRLAQELESPVPGALVAEGRIVEHLAKTDPSLTARLRAACESGRIAPAGGRYEEQPLDGCLPETIRDSLLHGHAVWRRALGAVPSTFAQTTGGWSAFLPQVLAQFGYTGVIWNLFDGTSLPDPGTGRIRWEGSGGECLDGIARPPLDARRSSTILQLPGRIGDAIDHDHTAVVSFAHHAGLASRWFDDLRRAASWSTALGTFVTPDELFRRTAGSGTTVAWEPDSYPVSRPPEPPTSGGGAFADPIAPRVEAARAEAKRIVAGRQVLAGLAGRAPRAVVPAGTPAPAATAPAKKRGLFGGVARGLFGGGADERLVLQNDFLRLRVHPTTGGILSLRRPADRGNRLSQHVALRTTRPPPPAGAPWEDPQERSEYVALAADAVERSGESTVESRGRIVDRRGATLATASQRVTLLPDLPLARLDLDVTVAQPGHERIAERYLACRFAWNENDDPDLRRGLHGQSVATERTLLTAPHFLALHQSRSDAPDVVIVTGGLPWHLRSTPHTLDSLLLAGDGTKGTFSLAVGIGPQLPWNLALDLLAGIAPGSRPPGGPTTAADNVRITWQGPVLDAGRTVGVRVGIVESEGRGGDVTVDWGFEIAAARFADVLGRPVAGREVTLDGRRTTLFLRRYGWACLDLLFPGAAAG